MYRVNYMYNDMDFYRDKFIYALLNYFKMIKILGSKLKFIKVEPLTLIWIPLL
jgi:hypothetical protein